MSSLLTQTVDKIFLETKDDDTRGTLFNKLLANGLLSPFQQGLSAWSEGASLIQAAAAHASSFPLAEQIAASYLAALATSPFFEHHVTLAQPHVSDLSLSERGITGRAHQVPHAAVANQVWSEASSGLDSLSLVLVEIRGVDACSGQNLASEPRDSLTFLGAPVLHRVALAPSPALGPVTLVGALTRSTQIVALAEAVLAMTVEHAKTRRQFGVPIASFQAVQHPIALLGCEVAALHAVLNLAHRALDSLDLMHLHEASELIAAAKVQAGRTAQIACQVGHAVHAAIGFTLEHRLHGYTQRLLSYRAEFGADRMFAKFLGTRTLERGTEQLWPHLVATSPTNITPGDAT